MKRRKSQNISLLNSSEGSQISSLRGWKKAIWPQNNNLMTVDRLDSVRAMLNFVHTLKVVMHYGCASLPDDVLSISIVQYLQYSNSCMMRSELCADVPSTRAKQRYVYHCLVAYVTKALVIQSYLKKSLFMCHQRVRLSGKSSAGPKKNTREPQILSCRLHNELC